MCWTYSRIGEAELQDPYNLFSTQELKKEDSSHNSYVEKKKKGKVQVGVLYGTQESQIGITSTGTVGKTSI